MLAPPPPPRSLSLSLRARPALRGPVLLPLEQGPLGICGGRGAAGRDKEWVSLGWVCEAGSWDWEATSTSFGFPGPMPGTGRGANVVFLSSLIAMLRHKERFNNTVPPMRCRKAVWDQPTRVCVCKAPRFQLPAPSVRFVVADKKATSVTYHHGEGRTWCGARSGRPGGRTSGWAWICPPQESRERRERTRRRHPRGQGARLSEEEPS